MSSKRKAKKQATLKKYLALIEQAAIKAGCELEELIRHVPFAVQAPKWFKPDRETERIKVVREEGIDKHPGFKIPRCILAFAKMMHSAVCAVTLFGQIQARAIRHSAPLAASAA